jgi:TolA-binding protein
MKNILGYSLALSLIVLSPAGLKSAEKAVDTATPTEDSQQLVSKQLSQKIADLKEALEGMRSSILKRDRASFRLYRRQARTALNEIVELGRVEVGKETKTEENAAKEGKMQSTPTPTPTPEPTATPAPTPETSPLATPTP